MKKKVLLITAIVAILAIAVSGTLAYFTAEDKATNTFTIGSVKVEIFENGEATEEDTIEFGKLTPVVNVEQPSEDESYIAKAVDVKNTGDNGAYIRVHIAVPSKLAHSYLCLDLENEGWKQVSTSAVAVVDEVKYDVFTYDYTTEVAPGRFTGKLLKGVYLASDVDLLKNEAGNLEFIRRSNGEVIDESGFVAHTKNADGSYSTAKVNVLVGAQAIQADGFADYEDALANFTTNPWSAA